jgi:ligand-binding SRPBCC domain-containing protein
MMSEHILESETMISASPERVFAFFSDASNLMRLTPPSLGFQILTPLPIRMGEGTLIDYKILLRGMPMGWRTRICRWNPPFEFIDEQLKGPYRVWIHHHTFEAAESGMTCMRDRVRYALPFAPFGEIVFPLVRAEVRGIFEFRRKAIWEIFPQHGRSQAEGLFNRELSGFHR